MAGEGLERLGYYNGQRLEALDYRLEQRYHIDARRMLNRGLFTPGVVSGFLVEKVAGETRKVRVRRGVALDPVGREVILLDDVLVDVPNQKPTEGPGYLLVARYSEEAVEGGDPWCGGPSGAPRPARFREEVVLEWSEHAPDHRRCQSGAEGLDCGVLLALVTLTPSCELDAIFTGVREYARPTHISQVQPFSFEGEKDIDKDNPKRLRFNINGVPASVRLYLWGDQFSTLYYTEMGRHSHATPSVSLSDELVDLNNHTHGLSTGSAVSGGLHGHGLMCEPNARTEDKVSVVTTATTAFYHQNANDTDPPDPPSRQPWIEKTGDHSHQLSGNTDIPSNNSSGNTHTHTLKVPAPTTEVGNTGQVPRAGLAHIYLSDLRVALRVGLVTTDITKAILRQLHWTSLGTSNPNDLLNTEGTGEIDLLAIANEEKIDLSLPGTYELTFGVAGGGGKIAYNLFVA